MQNSLTIQGLTRKFEHFFLQDVTFSLPSGSIMGLIGDNGAGKTTLIKLILNLIRRDAGEIKIFGEDNRSTERGHREQIGVVFDECHFSDQFCPADLGRIFSHTFSRWDGPFYNSLLDRFSLLPKEKLKCFSRGMKMKLSLCCALAHHPRLLLLDEATGGLDPVARNEVLDLLLDFIQEEEHSVLLSSHITSDLEKICDSIGFLHQGRMMFCEEKDMLLDRMGVLHCAKEQLGELPPSALLRVRQHQFGCDVLIDQREQMLQQHPSWAIDRASLDEIMLLYAKGERK